MRAKTEKISVVAMLTLSGALVSCGGNDKNAMSQKQAPEIAVMTVSPQDKALSKVYPAIIKGKTDIDIR
ncbi:MAG: efflux RND transporter periplasmic adaptor subunit, partial [Muribaculaceae bacterium]|nr:efflux RND transporter periplasmic adaptor subunit [Muribaculaceae bacterium]